MRGARDRAEERAVAAAIALPAVVVESKGHGHAGAAMALGPAAHVLFSRVMHHDPAAPRWPGRDRLILSAGHASLALYTQLYLTGYGLGLSDLAASRTLGSATPGHPELGHTAGVEMSTGPLGQGVASAVGLALAARRDAARHDHGYQLYDPTVYAIAGDGCLQEGVSGEASSLAGTLAADNLVLIWDDNRVTIDGPTEIAFAEDVRARYRAYGWRVIEIAEHTDLDAIERALLAARQRDGRPALVALRSVIAAPAPAKSGSPAAHAGPLGKREVEAVLGALGFAPDARLVELVEPAALRSARAARARGARLHADWERRRRAWAAAHPSTAAARERLLADAIDPFANAPAAGPAGPPGAETTAAARPAGSPQDPSGTPPGVRADALSALERVAIPAAGTAVATRKTNGAVIAALQEQWGGLWGGSADLAGSTSVAVAGEPAGPQNPDGEYIAFGIREHAQAAILSGIALHGLWRPFGSTYLAFSDYQRPSIRLAALMGLPAIYVYTHDSVAVGEDGPTHQPVEQIASLRTVPGLALARPADAAEVVAVWRRLMRTPDGPCALVLSRQEVPVLPARERLDEQVHNGGYVLFQHGGGDDLALIATGSEVALALAAGRALADAGIAVRVVSMPCVEWFAAAPAAWRESVLPSAVRARVAVEAGRGDAWYRWTGIDGAVVTVERFGESGAGAEVLARCGISTERVIETAHAVLARVP